ncbi:MAG: FAD-binding protein [Candidatus Binatus sp.]|uniref:FAD-binding protein n=1 Tax=Candidatus Binatus sp. TaxID=2811406 RepID=UPI0027272766|nr:FAD-binding protein [Candidatus Binatus sp.]MDO8431627.1 FAD-binding protein [Candidatus Binatus sp.]
MSQNPSASEVAIDASASGVLPIDKPILAEGADPIRWNSDCDVLVVGFGAAGASASIEAAHRGASVIVADRFGGGGASARSGGVVYAGGGTRYQNRAGFNDTPDAMYEYLRREVGDAVGESTLRDFCAQSAAMISWLESLGIEFDSTVPPKKTSYPPDGYYLYFSGNEAVPQFAGEHPPAPRGHRVKGAGLSGSAMFKAMRAAVDTAGVKVMTQSAVRRLVVDSSSGAVLGAEVWQLPPGASVARRHRRLSRWAERLNYTAASLSDLVRRRALALELTHARPIMVRTRGGVVLTTGGFIFNRAMVSRHAPGYLRNFRLGTSGCDGSGIRLGQSVGGDVAHLERISAWRFINPPLAWARGIVVDSRGSRFCNEEVYGALLGHEMCEHHGGKAWLVIDSHLRREAIREALFGGLWAFQSMPAIMLMLTAKRGRTIEDLARKIGADANLMRLSCDAYNSGARGGDDAMGKSSAMRQALEAPPFYAVNISAGSRIFPCPVITLGGLRIDEATGAVKQASADCVPGLYAAGRAAVGIASNHYVSGLALADCIWSGRRAGKSASKTALRNASQARATA